MNDRLAITGILYTNFVTLMSCNCLIATLSSGSRALHDVVSDVVYTIPLIAVKICDPCMIIGIPGEFAVDASNSNVLQSYNTVYADNKRLCQYVNFLP